MSEERARERLAYEVGLARNQLAGEQREREAAERRLTAEVEELRRRCQGCSSIDIWGLGTSSADESSNRELQV